MIAGSSFVFYAIVVDSMIYRLELYFLNLKKKTREVLLDKSDLTDFHFPALAHDYVSLKNDLVFNWTMKLSVGLLGLIIPALMFYLMAIFRFLWYSDPNSDALVYVWIFVIIFLSVFNIIQTTSVSAVSLNMIDQKIERLITLVSTYPINKAELMTDPTADDRSVLNRKNILSMIYYIGGVITCCVFNPYTNKHSKQYIVAETKTTTTSANDQTPDSASLIEMDSLTENTLSDAQMQQIIINEQLVVRKDKINKTLYHLIVYLRSQVYVFKFFDIWELTRLRMLGIVSLSISALVTIRNYADNIEQGLYSIGYQSYRRYMY